MRFGHTVGKQFETLTSKLQKTVKRSLPGLKKEETKGDILQQRREKLNKSRDLCVVFRRWEQQCWHPWRTPLFLAGREPAPPHRSQVPTLSQSRKRTRSHGHLITTSLEPWAHPWGLRPASPAWPSTPCRSPEVRFVQISLFSPPSVFMGPFRCSILITRLPSQPFLLPSLSQDFLSMLITQPFSFLPSSTYICHAGDFMLPSGLLLSPHHSDLGTSSPSSTWDLHRTWKEQLHRKIHALLLLFLKEKYSFEWEDPFNSAYNLGSMSP